MGTSTDSGGRQESELIQIPWSCVNYCITKELIQLLNPDSVMGRDWKGLASRLGYTTLRILSIESEKSNNTEVLFNDYGRSPNATFNKVYNCLDDMKRQDCMDVLEENFESIKQEYYRQQQQKSSSFHLSGGEMHSPASGHYWSSHPGPSFMCGCVSQPMAGHPYPSHPCCSAVHRIRGGHHHPCSLPAHQQHMPFAAPGYVPSHLQMNVQLEPSPVPNHSGNPSNPQCRTGFDERIMSDPSNRQPLSLAPQNTGHAYNFDRSVPNVHHQVSPVGENHPMALPEMSFQSLHHQYSKRQGDRLPAGDVTSHSQALAQNHPSYRAFNNNMHLPHNINPQDSSNLVSNSSSEASNNSWQQVNISLNQSQTNIASNSASAVAMQHNAFNYQNSEHTDSKVSLKKLVQISQVPHEYQPTEEYTRVVAEQKIEEKKINKSEKNYDDKHTPSLASDSSSGSSRSNGSRSGAAGAESCYTYPMRAKFNARAQIQPNDMAKDFASISIKKSPSLPQSYKPQVYQRVHGARLFLTYSSDCKEHTTDIYCLCMFLKDNNFKSYVDVKCKPQAEGKTNQNEYLTRFEVADHVLMCISPKYLEDISKANSPPPNERQLHTRHFYEHMQREHMDNLKKEPSSPRAVIVLFKSVTAEMLPEWMQNYPIYKWPSDYEDLFWILMKPQDKIKAKYSKVGSETSNKNISDA